MKYASELRNKLNSQQNSLPISRFFGQDNAFLAMRKEIVKAGSNSKLSRRESVSNFFSKMNYSTFRKQHQQDRKRLPLINF